MNNRNYCVAMVLIGIAGLIVAIAKLWIGVCRPEGVDPASAQLAGSSGDVM
ncbi:MAG: hypothetical protein IID49_10300 [Proteobacteria bacterium]|nr:hypothetical protein [Pseudomonadota bacterium]